ncbi:MAG: glycosyl hydrolase family 28 protein [Pseudomonadota bacterium]
MKLPIVLAALIGPVAFCSAHVSASEAEAAVCRPQDRGAAPNDNAEDTAAIQAAIDACAGINGVVSLSPGVWRTGGLTLGSDLVFRLEAGAELRLIPEIGKYIALNPDAGEGDRRYVALHAPHAKNLRIEGPGAINGSGPDFWDENFYALGIPRPTRPRPGPVIELADCKHVVVDSLRMENLPAYAIRFHRCFHGEAKRVVIHNDPRSPNTDGIQIRDSADITIRGADIATGDDAIVLKSGARAVERIKVEDSRLMSDDAALKFGTGSRHGVKDSVFRNITVEDSRYGVAIFAIDGGVHERNLFEGLKIETGGRHARTYPIFVDVDRREADRGWGGVSGLTFRDIEIASAGASLIAGNPKGPVSGLRLENISIARRGQTEALNRAGKPRGNVTIKAQSESVDYSRENAELVLAHIRDLTILDVKPPPCNDLSGRRIVAAIDIAIAKGSDRIDDVSCSGAESQRRQN